MKAPLTHLKKHSGVRAIQFTGDNAREVVEFFHPDTPAGQMPEDWWMLDSGRETRILIREGNTLPNAMEVFKGEWIVGTERGIRCFSDEQFWDTYDQIDQALPTLKLTPGDGITIVNFGSSDL